MITDIYAPDVYTGTGLQVDFSITFEFTADTDVQALIREDVVDTVLTAGVDYTISGTTLTCTVAPTTDQELVIYSEIALTQQRQFRNTGPLDMTQIEAGLDRLTLIVQQQGDAIQRKVGVNEGETVPDNYLADCQAAVTSASESASAAATSETNAEGFKDDAEDAAEAAAASAASLNFPSLSSATENELIVVNAAKTGYDLSGILITALAVLANANAWAKAQTYGSAELDISSGVVTWDMEADPAAVLVLDENVTSLTMSNAAAGGTYELTVIQDATGSRTLAWPAALLWPGGSEVAVSSDANAEDVFTFSTRADGASTKTRVVGVQALAVDS